MARECPVAVAYTDATGTERQRIDGRASHGV